MPGEHLLAIGDAYFVGIGEHRQHPLHVDVRDGVIVQIKTDIRPNLNSEVPISTFGVA
jgi:hypothetical protein